MGFAKPKTNFTINLNKFIVKYDFDISDKIRKLRTSRDPATIRLFQLEAI